MTEPARAALYFAYGSNMSSRQMAERCPGAAAAGIGLLRGFRICFDRYSEGRQGHVADIVEDAAGEVWGVRWLVTEEHLAALDRFEGVARGAYRRRNVSVEVDGVSQQAIAYQVVEPEDEGAPSDSYLAPFRAGPLNSGS
jgi:gamma-glutamylcyclotransferase (GGCT)/AIG2-like uncharacterized protein YtfP